MFIRHLVMPMSKQLRADGKPEDAQRFLVAGVNTLIGTLQGPAHNGYSDQIFKMVEVLSEEKLQLGPSGSNKVGFESRWWRKYLPHPCTEQWRWCAPLGCSCFPAEPRRAGPGRMLAMSP